MRQKHRNPVYRQLAEALEKAGFVPNCFFHNHRKTHHRHVWYVLPLDNEASRKWNSQEREAAEAKVIQAVRTIIPSAELHDGVWGIGFQWRIPYEDTPERDEAKEFLESLREKLLLAASTLLRPDFRIYLNRDEYRPRYKMRLWLNYTLPFAVRANKSVEELESLYQQEEVKMKDFLPRAEEIIAGHMNAQCIDLFCTSQKEYWNWKRASWAYWDQGTTPRPCRRQKIVKPENMIKV